MLKRIKESKNEDTGIRIDTDNAQHCATGSQANCAG
jgi:hypothetical protein